MRSLVAEEHPGVALEAYNSTNLLGMCAQGVALEAYSSTNLLEMCVQLDLLGERKYWEEAALVFQLALLAVSARHVNFEKKEE